MERVIENKTKILEILKTVQMESYLPTYIIDILAFNGYANFEAISLLDDKDIKRLEEFSRNILTDILEDEEKATFFGIFSKKPSLFYIVDGDRKTLDMFINKCKIYVEKKTKSTEKVQLAEKKINRKRRHSLDDTEREIDASEKAKIILHIKNVIRSYQIKLINNLGEEDRGDFLSKIDQIEVEVTDQMALIQCCICKFKSKAYCENDSVGNKKKWVLSNVNRHFKTHFKGAISGREKINKKHQTSGQTSIQKSTITKFFKKHSPPLKLQTQPSVHLLTDNAGHNICQAEEGTSVVVDSSTEIEVDSDQGSEDFTQSRIITEGTTAKDKVGDSATSPQTMLTPRPTHRSREQKAIKRRQLIFDPNQTKITSYFEICKDIEHQIHENQIIHEAFSSSAGIFKKIVNAQVVNKEMFDETPQSFFEMVKTSVAKNLNGRSSCGNRYSEELKKLCLYLFLTSGRLAYETLAANIPRGLPSISTLGRELSDTARFKEGELAIKELKLFLEKRKYPLHVFISEDQTAVVRRPRYDPLGNQLIGYALTNSNETGFPVPNQNQINSVKDIKNIIESSDMVKNAYVYMAQPMADRAPAFCLTIFGSTNSFRAEDVLLRWKHITEQAHQEGIVVEGFSSDGDSRCLKAMKIMAGMPTHEEQHCPYSPYFKAKYSLDNPISLQDTVHIGTKIKTRLLNSNVVLKMGNYEVSKEHLSDLIRNVTKDKHFLCLSFLDGSDKMNFEAIDKMSSTCVTDLLMKNDVSKATGQLLMVTRYILDSFLDKSLTLQRRIYLIWYATFFMRYWRAWIMEQNNISLTRNWITLNVYTCIELNAHGLLLLIERHRAAPELICPWLCSSQPCEKFFRQTRSMTTTCSTVVNYDMLDLLQRRHRIHTINSIISDSGNKFIFPRENTVRLGTNDFPNIVANFPTTEELCGIIEEAKKNVTIDSENLGMNLSDALTQAAFEQVSIPEILHVDRLQSEDICEKNVESEDRSETNIEEQTVNEEDRRDIDNEKSVFENLEGFTELNIKDCSSKKRQKEDGSLLGVKVNTKEMLVKKSTLCWLFSSRLGRLSSDRLLRCKSMGGASGSFKNKNKKQKKDKIATKAQKNNKKTSENVTESETSESDNYSEQSELECESFDEGREEEVSVTREEVIDVRLENYYAVCYLPTWYIGRVVEEIDKRFSKIKFLKSSLDTYVWPKEKNEDIQIVENKFIFYGPISLLGNEPFYLKRHQRLEIEQKFKATKRILQNYL